MADADIRVLIVDDDEMVRQTLGRCCEIPGMTVVAMAADAAAAHDAVAAERPDVVLMDRRLGDVDGITLAGELMATKPGLKIIIVTGASSPELEDAARQAGCWGCIQKDMSIRKSLPEAIRQAVAAAA